MKIGDYKLKTIDDIDNILYIEKMYLIIASIEGNKKIFEEHKKIVLKLIDAMPKLAKPINTDGESIFCPKCHKFPIQCKCKKVKK